MSTDLSNIDLSDLRTRLSTSLTRLDQLFILTAPHIREIGMIREECGLIYQELLRRGAIKEDPNVPDKGKVSKA